MYDSYLAEYRERRRIALVNALLEEKVSERTRELHDTQLEVIQRLGQAVEWRDEETGDHVERMSGLCYALGRAAGLDEAEASVLKRAAALHDVGKIGVPDAVLRKAGPLDAEEWELMKLAHRDRRRHPRRLALAHRPDGGGDRAHPPRALGRHGYPEGLRGEEIPLVRAASARSATSSTRSPHRPYKPSWSVDERWSRSRARPGSSSTPSSWSCS